MGKCWEQEEREEEEETGRTFVDKSSPRPFQKTLTWKSLRSQQNYNAMQTLGVPKNYSLIKVFITCRDRHNLSRRVIKAKFFERVWFPSSLLHLLGTSFASTQSPICLVVTSFFPSSRISGVRNPSFKTASTAWRIMLSASGFWKE